MNNPPGIRNIGRTTRMLKEAVSLSLQGVHVQVYMINRRQVDYAISVLHRLIDDPAIRPKEFSGVRCAFVIGAGSVSLVPTDSGVPLDQTMDINKVQLFDHAAELTKEDFGHWARLQTMRKQPEKE